MALIGRFPLSDGTMLLAVTHDPSSTGTDAPLGSLCLRVGSGVANAVYQKVASSSTGWALRGGIGNPAPIAQGGGGVNTTLDLSGGPTFALQLNAATTNLLLTNPTAGVLYRIEIIQPAGGGLVVWPASVKWPGAVAPTLSVGGNKIDQVTLYYDGTIYLGNFLGANYS